MKSDRILLCYRDGSSEIILGSILADRCLDTDTALSLLGIDMDEWADSQGWSGWDWDDLYTRHEDE